MQRHTSSYTKYDVFPDISDVHQEDHSDGSAATEEQFLLEPAHASDSNAYVLVNTRLDYQYRSQDLTDVCLYDFVSHYHKKVIDKSDRALLKQANNINGQRLSTQGTRMSERHSMTNAHPQASSHIMIKHTVPVVPVLVGPQIPRRERGETHERYCRALLTLFMPWRSVCDLCASNQTWSEAFEDRKPSISANANRIIENIQLLHECKSDRDEHLHQMIKEAQTANTIDPILMPSYERADENDPDNDPEELLQMLALVSETTTKAYPASLGNNEQRYLCEALDAIDKTERFTSLNGKSLASPC